MSTSGLERRASAYAALGDPSRLAIIDLLAYADLASGQLAAQLDLPTNLVAHHLRCHLFNLQPDAFTEMLREQASDLVRPPVTFDELLERLGRVVPVLTSRVRQHRHAVR